MSKHKRPFDQNLVDAIGNLNWPLLNNNGHRVYLRHNARYETGAEHIAGKLHEPKVRDIKLLPDVLRQPYLFRTTKEKGLISSLSLRWWLMLKKMNQKPSLPSVHLKDARSPHRLLCSIKQPIILLSKVEIQRSDHGAFLVNGSSDAGGNRIHLTPGTTQ